MEESTSNIPDLGKREFVRSNSTRIPRKPVPRRFNSRRSSTRRPSTSRSFTQAFSWLGAVLPERQPPLQEQEIAEENISPILPRAQRKSWRYTSRFDPRMDSGLTLYDPDLQVNHKRQMSDASTVVEALNVEWRLPPLRFSYTDSDHQSIINAAIDAPANLPPEKIGDEPPPNGGTLAWLQVLGALFLYFNSWLVATHPDGLVPSLTVHVGALSTPLGCFKRTTRPPEFCTSHHRIFRGSALFKPFWPPWWASSPARCMTQDIFDTSSLLGVSWSLWGS